MQRSIQESISIWDQAKANYINPLTESNSAEVCVVGAGIAGLTIAYLLQKIGKKVIILEAIDLAAGETSRTTAHLTNVLDDRFYNLIAKFGLDNAKLAAASHKEAINCIENIIKIEKIDCQFERTTGYLIKANNEKFADEFDALKAVGFVNAVKHENLAIPNFSINDQAIGIPDQATFNVIEYINGLAKAFIKLGGQLYTKARVVEVVGGKNAFVRTESGLNIKASSIVVATNSPINAKITIHTKQAAYRTYVVAFAINKDLYPSFLLWDMQDPYHYVRVLRETTHDLLIVGGEDHKVGQACDMDLRYKRLEDWARNKFNNLGEVRYCWSGQVLEPIDHLAFIGRNPHDEKNVYIVTGDSGHGMTHATIAGILIADLILGKSNKWANLYDPSRVSFKSSGTFISENSNAAFHMLKDWVKPAEIGKEEELQPGQGAILRNGVRKFAIYRDESGKLYKKSAVCTHMGCIVQWNKGEKSWDCPCHGSRFSYDGKVLNGPAKQPLAD